MTRQSSRRAVISFSPSKVVEGGDAAVAPVSKGVSPGAEVGEDDCGSGGQRYDSGESPGGGDPVSAEDGHVKECNP
jgi:hypothetical protein